MKYREIVKDLNGAEVKASDINRNGLFKNFEKGMFGTLRNESWSFYADVECVSKRGNTYTFRSTTYGHKFIVNFDDDTVICQG